ncbi:leucyl aminopeptidase (aminopeptidase T) [Sporomusaceae bacterium BoRhaA]|uniref:aminopeptidase n=1 Tax=Pelorhabdus rhamnosifermentans TaxID=2772457 RepID=UPI001C06316A|nr:aminopeptidase [Pelorhabdus rhamnosifermentans]MBU2699527.1 leucyl aminopeptidase (aminopeptidase T) [Pelorhabdus rhamnosifermentans]
MQESLVKVSKQFLQNCLGLKAGESLLIVTDEVKKELAESVFLAGKTLGAEPMLAVMTEREKSGQEPPKVIASAMAAAQVVVCITEHSLTHTQARKAAAAAGARLATMPGITSAMFLAGAISADYANIKRVTERITGLLTHAEKVKINKSDYCLTFSIAGRTGIASTGVYLNPGESGNLPSGEAYIAPLEGTAEGQILVDASISGIGKLATPLLLTLAKGRLVKAEGETGEILLSKLGEAEGRMLAEFGIGTNDKAKIIGVVLEDEKVYRTIHVAFGSNDTFGGNVSAGVHIDCVVREPDVWLDDRLMMKQGQFQAD